MIRLFIRCTRWVAPGRRTILSPWASRDESGSPVRSGDPVRPSALPDAWSPRVRSGDSADRRRHQMRGHRGCGRAIGLDRRRHQMRGHAGVVGRSGSTVGVTRCVVTAGSSGSQEPAAVAGAARRIVHACGGAGYGCGAQGGYAQPPAAGPVSGRPRRLQTAGVTVHACGGADTAAAQGGCAQACGNGFGGGTRIGTLADSA